MRKLVVGLALVAAIGAGAWWLFRTREITVWAYTDYAFRFQHPDWSPIIEGRFQEVNRIYKANGTGVRWKLLNSAETDPVADVPGIDSRRASMALHLNDKAEIFVLLTGVKEKDRTGSVSPFTRVAVVVDFPEKSETLNGRLMAHELAHLFGAPHDPAWLETLMSEKPETNKLSAPTVALIRRMRDYPFAKGIDGLLDNSWEKKAVAAIAEDDTEPNQNPLAHAHAVVGTALMNERKQEQAMVQFHKAVEADPNSVSARLNLAEALSRNGEDEKALEQVREVQRLDPDKPLTHRAMGALLGRTHQPEMALRELQVAARMEPDNVENLVLTGMQQAAMPGHLEEAILTFQQAAKSHPDSRSAQEALQRAQVMKQKLQDEVTIQRAALQRNPDDPEAHYRLGKVEARMGDLTGAIRDFRRSAELRPSSGATHVELADTYLLQGNSEGAWDEVRKARALGTEPPPALVAKLAAKK